MAYVSHWARLPEDRVTEVSVRGEISGKMAPQAFGRGGAAVEGLEVGRLLGWRAPAEGERPPRQPELWGHASQLAGGHPSGFSSWSSSLATGAQSIRATVTEHHRPGGLEATGRCSSWFWKL